MIPFLHDENYVSDFEKTLVKSYDIIKKEKKYGDSIYVHTREVEEKKEGEVPKRNYYVLKKKIYLLGLNYNQYIHVSGKFRFRLIKGLVEFNGQIIKPSTEYVNVRIPPFYPAFKLTALNINISNITKGRNLFSFETDIKANKNSENENENENEKKGKQEVNTQNNIDATIKRKVTMKEKDKDSDDGSEKRESFRNNNTAESTVKNYVFCLNLLPNENEKKRDLYIILTEKKEEQMHRLSSKYMLDVFQQNSFYERYPVIVAFQRKKDFLYYLYSDTGQKLNISGNVQNRSTYINTYQFDYALKEFIQYICNKKSYSSGSGSVAEKVKLLKENETKWENRVDEEDLHSEFVMRETYGQYDNKCDSYNRCDVVKECCIGGSVNSISNYSKDTSLSLSNDSQGHVPGSVCFSDTHTTSIVHNMWRSGVNINQFADRDDVYSLFLMGDKNKGKSFLVIKFINSLLNYYDSVLLLDVDIGQPIIGMSGFLSIYKIKYPLNNYNFFDRRNKCIKRIFYGSCRINDNLSLFLNCLNYIYYYLYYEYLEKKRKTRTYANDDSNNNINSNNSNGNGNGSSSNNETYERVRKKKKKEKEEEEEEGEEEEEKEETEKKEKKEKEKQTERRKRRKNVYPLVINTFGWISDLGLDLLKWNIFLSKCDFIIQLDSLKLPKDAKHEQDKNVELDALSHALFNDFLWYNSKRKKMHNIISLRNRNITVIPKGFSVLHMIKGYSAKDVKDFYLYNFFLEFENVELQKKGKKQIPRFLYNTGIRDNTNEYHQETVYKNSSKQKIMNHTEQCIQEDYLTPSDYINDETDSHHQGPPLSSVDGTKGATEKEIMKCETGISQKKPKRDFVITAEEYFLQKKYIRVMNFVSFNKIKKWKKLEGDKYNNPALFINPRYLRSYRFFCHFFYKFKKFIFYIHSFSFNDRIIDFFKKHNDYVSFIFTDNERALYEKENENQSYQMGSSKEQFFKNTYGRRNEYYNPQLERKEMSQHEKRDSNKEIEKDDINETHEEITKSETGERKQGSEKSNSEINYLKLQTNSVTTYDHQRSFRYREKIALNANIPSDVLYFVCAIFHLANVKLSNIEFNNEYFKRDIAVDTFYAYKYFFNNIVCLCYDDEEENIRINNNNNNNNNNNEERECRKRNDCDMEKRTYFYIDYIHINGNFRRINYNIKHSVLKRRNVKIIPVKETFRHIVTAYIKIIDNMKLIIYLPYWFKDFDLLKRVNTFVSGSYLFPDNANEIFSNYASYMNIVCNTEAKLLKILKRNKFNMLKNNSYCP